MSIEFLIIAGLVGALVVVMLRRRTGSKRAMAIASPRLGMLNLKGEAGRELLADDKLALGPLFARTEQSDGEPPQCDVLFLYCDVMTDGSISGTTASLRELIHRSGASVVVVATENTGDSYRAAAKHAGVGRANLVMTLQRKGAAFAAFYQRLFGQMFDGTTMPVAWVRLAPQGPGQDHPDCPDAVFACERGQISFR